MEPLSALPSADSTPRLAPPGAGLPGPERFMVSCLFHWQAWRASRAEAEALFAAQRSRVLELVKSCPQEKRGIRALIKRLRGMEDSSRYWSVLMTVDHLRIVNRQVTFVLKALAAGKVPERQANTAAVKPDAGVDETVIEHFEAVNNTLVKTAAGIADLRTAVKYTHPWFGALNAAQWHFMAGFHMRLHVKQIERILALLNVN